MAQLLYTTTGKAIALTRWTFVGKLMSLLFNILSRFVIKISGRNINNLKYTDDTALMVESEEELKSLLMKVKEEKEKAGLKLSIKKTKIMASGPITSQKTEGRKVEAVTDFLGFQNHCRW